MRDPEIGESDIAAIGGGGQLPGQQSALAIYQHPVLRGIEHFLEVAPLNRDA